jgi:lactoylglutathione lyase
MDFYGTVLGLELGFCDPERRVAFYWIGSGRDSMLGVWEHLPWAASCDDKRIERQHLAFQVSFNDLQPIIERAKQRGMRLTNYFEEITDEPVRMDTRCLHLLQRSRWTLAGVHREARRGTGT